MTLPLSGLRVVDFSRVLAGPHCGKLLLDLGAEVIKVEPPMGDLSRLAQPAAGSVSGYFAQQNSGKRDICVDLNVPESREVIRTLCDTAEVIIENFRPGALASFGLGYEDVSERNPGIVYASISGYGQHGSWRSRMAYAPTIQAESGFTRNTHNQFGVAGATDGRTDSLSHADVYSGLHATIAVLAALRHRAETGEGQYIDVAMASVITSVNERVHYDLSDIDLGDEAVVLGATDIPFFISPEGEEFALSMSLTGTGMFDFYRNAMRRADLKEDPRFLTPSLRRQNFAALREIVQTWIWTFKDMAALDAQLDEAKLATGRLRDIGDFNQTEWAKSWVTTREVPDRAGGTFTIPAPPWHFSKHDGSLTPQEPALLGEHNVEILRELGYEDDDIEKLYKLNALIEPGKVDEEPVS
jgi:crotonobetainyl-CoA:carnitine CoA-transferase CaiB-like acyl-CoA transferase